MLVKVLLVDVKNLENLVNTLKEKGYKLELGPHSVLLDHSEVLSISVMRSSSREAIIIAHYITPYYRVETLNIDSDEAYLKELVKVKYSGEKWSIPVNPVIVLAFSEDLVRILENYRDDYPVPDGEDLVKEYRRRNPGYAEVPRLLLARFLEKLDLAK